MTHQRTDDPFDLRPTATADIRPGGTHDSHHPPNYYIAADFANGHEDCVAIAACPHCGSPDRWVWVHYDSSRETWVESRPARPVSITPSGTSTPD